MKSDWRERHEKRKQAFLDLLSDGNWWALPDMRDVLAEHPSWRGPRGGRPTPTWRDRMVSSAFWDLLEEGKIITRTDMSECRLVTAYDRAVMRQERLQRAREAGFLRVA